jgi:hypothetical protein
MACQGSARSCALRASNVHDVVSCSLTLNLSGESGLFQRRHIEAERTR